MSKNGWRSVLAIFLIAGLAAGLIALTIGSVNESLTPADRGLFGPFARSMNVQPHGYTIIKDPTGKAPHPVVERFEVRAGDCHFNNGWSDCDKDRERSELRETGALSPVGTSAWYGWWFYLPADWPNVYPTKTTIAQFHQVRAHPVWMFLLRHGELVLDDQSIGRTTRYVPLVEANRLKGVWHRIEVHAHWSHDKTGFLKVYVNGDLKVDHKGRTMTTDMVYFRYGVYRSFISRYRSDDADEVIPTQAAYFANVMKAEARDALK